MEKHIVPVIGMIMLLLFAAWFFGIFSPGVQGTTETLANDNANSEIAICLLSEDLYHANEIQIRDGKCWLMKAGENWMPLEEYIQKHPNVASN